MLVGYLVQLKEIVFGLLVVNFIPFGASFVG